MKHTCSNCGNAFAVVRSTRSELAWGLGLRGIYSTNYAKTIDEFPVVVCPKCGHREKDPNLRVFGLFTPSQFKVVVVLVLLALAAGSAVDLISGR